MENEGMKEGIAMLEPLKAERDIKAKTFPLNKMLLILGIVFIALNLRPAITAVGPLIGAIQTDLSISSGLAGLLTTLPLLAFAFFSPLTPAISRRYGMERVIFVGILLLTGGILLRSLGHVATLFTGTVLIGAGIAVANVLLPSVIRKHFHRHVGYLTSLYTTAMGITAGLASGLSAPLAFQYGWGWQAALLFWGGAAFVALLIWLPQISHKPDLSPAPSVAPSEKTVWRSPLAWQVTLYMGSQSLLYYCLITWLPEILMDKGVPISQASWMLAIMQFVGMPSSLLIPVLAHRFKHQKGLALFTGLSMFCGVLGLWLDQALHWLLLWIILIALGSGGAISLALTMIGLRSRSAQQAAQLSGMAQAVGYLLAAVGPVLLGSLYDLTQTWTPALLLLMAASLFIGLIGLGAGRNRQV